MSMKHARTIGLLVGIALLAPVLTGCRYIKKGDNAQMMAQRLESAPPIMRSELDGRHMLIMQAPNPGWSFGIDRDEREREGWVLYITIRQPDPGFMYPQRIVEKRLLSAVESDKAVRVMARMLEHGETGTKDDYAPLTLADSLEP
jgi:hypothetical protein